MSRSPEADKLREEIAARSGKNGTNGNSPLVAHPASDLSQVRAHRWLWHNRILIGYLNLLLGREGVGKGTLVAKLISDLTKGEVEGVYYGKPISVGIIGDEDGFYDTWVPRLLAAGADLHRVWQIEQPDGGYISLTDDKERIAHIVREKELQFLYFDQLLDNIGAKVDDWRGKQVRDALRPCRALGKDLSIAVLAALHPNKHGESFRNLVSGTSAFNQVARSGLLLSDHPQDKSKRVLVQGKGNYSAVPAGISFRIHGEKHFINQEEHDIGVIDELFESSLTIDDLMKSATGKEPTAAEMAEGVITQLLPKDGKWHDSAPISEQCKEDGISNMALKRARDHLGVEYRRTKQVPSRTEYRWDHEH